MPAAFGPLGGQIWVADENLAVLSTQSRTLASLL